MKFTRVPLESCVAEQLLCQLVAGKMALREKQIIEVNEIKNKLMEVSSMKRLFKEGGIYEF